jgi:hypothetical protein
MPSARTLTTALALSFLLACSGTDPSSPIGSSDSTVKNAESDGGVAPDVDVDGPHALGTIVLGESHASGTSTPRRIVAVSFVPDAALSRVATRNVAGCEHTPAATAAPKAPDAGASESFDAGPVAVSGATTPITLYPPYTYEGDTDGAPFLAGAKLEVQGSGAVGAGFEKFDETFTATQFLQTSPALAQLPRTSVFGTGSLPVAWAAGGDDIFITVSGAGGALRCKASDAEGRFEIPREVIKTALGGSTNLSLSVARERTETKKGKKTRGELTGATVQPTGWLALTTTSAETASFQCSGAECTGVSATTCHDCRTSACKTEFDACTADATCPMLRTCLDACADSACRNTCFTKWPEPAAKAKNGALYKCQCVTTCVSSCTAECR